MKHGIATVCLSGDLREKLHAAATAGFEAVEIFEPDLVTAPESPEEVRAMAARLGLELALYQPMRDVEGVDDAEFARVEQRAAAKFALCERLGIDLVLVCSNVATATIDDHRHSAAQLRRLADLGARHGVRLAFEALAWGRFVSDYRDAWRIVELADHPGLGVCLDSFHILSRGHDLDDISRIPGERILYLQLADAPALTMDVLSWSRHHRLFPGEGDWDLVDFTTRVLDAGYRGPLSLEVFNDVYRQTPPERTAAQARRSLLQLEDRMFADSQLPPAQVPTAFDFVEITGERLEGIERLLRQLGMRDRGPHRSKPVRLWESGEARIILNEQGARDTPPHVSAIGVVVGDAEGAARRSRSLGVPEVLRRTDPGDARLDGVVAPGGTQLFFADARGGAPAWRAEFAAAAPEVAADAVRGVDHVNTTHSWRSVDAAVLFARSVLGLHSQARVEVPSPAGLVASRVMRNRDGTVRLPFNVLPVEAEEHGGDAARARHIALRTDDAIGLARRARASGLSMLPVPANYYDDLDARLGLSFEPGGAELLSTIRDLDLLYDRDADGAFLHFYTETIGAVFFEIVQRLDAYDGYGAANAPVRLAAQRAGARASV